MRLRNLFYLMLILPILFINTGCSSDSGTSEPEVVINEAEVLIQYLEANGDVLNIGTPAMITAEAVRTNQVTSASQYIIDIRSADAFAAGHIEGAVNVAFGSVLTHVQSLTTTYNTIVIVCYSGQTAGYVTQLLRMMGHSNVKDMKWGMSGWNAECANSWLPKLSNAYATNLVTTSTPKAAAGDLPTLGTGLSEGTDILANRVAAIFTEGFSAATTDIATVMANPSSYYIVNYWGTTHYELGHINGAIQYTPGTDLKLAASLKTLPTDKTIVVYCYTGQTSAHVAAELRAMGYDAKTLLFGVNSFAYDWMVGHNMTHFDEGYIMGYPYVTD